MAGTPSLPQGAPKSLVQRTMLADVPSEPESFAPLEWLRQTGTDMAAAQEAWADHRLAEAPAGVAWDVVRLTHGVGWETLRHLHTMQAPLGPVLHTSDGVEFLVAVGAADDWDLPDTTVIPAGEIVLLPHPVVIAPNTCHARTWITAPRHDVGLTDAADLYGAYAAALASLDAAYGRRR
ncbi:hypothetical protein [Streptomyces violens]|uniref:hypothetical protein n=1 Tax=Streptomyces violens TaxID=66377 RepID=UPI001FE0F6E6|nr:hypothetical protein [Streptomyces violens]